MPHVMQVPIGTFCLLVFFALLGLLGAIVHVANWIA